MTTNLITQIDSWAVNDPERVAYNFLGQKNTYGELKQYSDALAARIKKLGLSREQPIIVYGGQTFAMIATFLGIVKAGHAYIPVDAHSPLKRLQDIKQIAQPAACVAVNDLPVNDWDIPVITADELDHLFTNSANIVDSVTPEDYVAGDDTYYIIFTSGTTGMPKGVQISHDNLQSFTDWMAEDFGINHPMVTLSQPPYSFDLSVMDLYPTLLHGGMLDVLPQETTANFKELFAALPKYQIENWVSTPSFIEMCLLSPDFNEQSNPTIKNILFCGEELTHATAAAVKQRFPKAHVYNTYGPTETTVAVTAVEITNEILDSYQRLPIGWPKNETPVVLLNEDNQLVDQGEDGEIVIMGPSVSKGYLNNPEKTNQAFIEVDGKRAYKTGDLGQYDENGQLLYKGRVDFQVKLHGFRIELEEVDQHLTHVAEVAQAITVPRYGANHKVQQLVAYIVPQDKDFAGKERELTQSIKAQLQKNMMSYMMPGRFVFVDAIPLTPNGKLDRKLLMSEVNGK